VPVTTILKAQSPIAMASIAFFGLVGIVFLVLMAISGFPPHVGAIGIASLIASYGLLMQRKWAPWIVFALFFVGSVFSIFTLYYVIATDAVASAGMIVYVALTWLFTLIVARRAKMI
jgi:hypothetical protein